MIIVNILLFRSPTHAGGLLAIDRQWFFELGAYDPGIRVWGAEQYVYFH
jgi:polypeptide N-acetylgalactosaminyltransferase